MHELNDLNAFRQYKKIAIASADKANTNFQNIKSNLFTPYYDLKSNIQFLGHPFCHGIQMIRSLLRLLQGYCSLFTLLFSPDASKSFPHLFFGMVKLTSSIVTELTNIMLASISIVTRLIASIINIGYVTTKNELSKPDFENDAFSLSNMFKLFKTVQLNVQEKFILFNDEICHEMAYRII